MTKYIIIDLSGIEKIIEQNSPSSDMICDKVCHHQTQKLTKFFFKRIKKNQL